MEESSHPLTLHFSVCRGEGLAPKDSNGYSDPYCEISFKRKKGERKSFLTSISYETLNPVWNFSTFLGRIDKEDVIVISCWDKDNWIYDDFQGVVRIELKEIMDLRGKVKKWYTLCPREGKGDKEIYGKIEVEFQIEYDDENAVITPIFGSSISSLMADQKLKERALRFFLNSKNQILTNAIDEEGIFRLSGSYEEVRVFQESINRGYYIDLSRSPSDPSKPANVHSVPDLFKRFLREMTEPLLTFELYDTFRAVIDTEAPDERLSRMKEALTKVPKDNYSFLLHLVELCFHISNNSALNKMDAANLATIFGHSIWRNKSEDMEESLQQVQRASQLFHLMLENYSFFFEDQLIMRSKQEKPAALLSGRYFPCHDEIVSIICEENICWSISLSGLIIEWDNQEVKAIKQKQIEVGNVSFMVLVVNYLVICFSGKCLLFLNKKTLDEEERITEEREITSFCVVDSQLWLGGVGIIWVLDLEKKPQMKKEMELKKKFKILAFAHIEIDQEMRKRERQRRREKDKIKKEEKEKDKGEKKEKRRERTRSMKEKKHKHKHHKDKEHEEEKEERNENDQDEREDKHKPQEKEERDRGEKNEEKYEIDEEENEEKDGEDKEKKEDNDMQEREKSKKKRRKKVFVVGETPNIYIFHSKKYKKEGKIKFPKEENGFCEIIVYDNFIWAIPNKEKKCLISVWDKEKEKEIKVIEGNECCCLTSHPSFPILLYQDQQSVVLTITKKHLPLGSFSSFHNNNGRGKMKFAFVWNERRNCVDLWSACGRSINILSIFLDFNLWT